MKNKVIKTTPKQIFINLCWNIISGSIGYIINFIITPLITNSVGIEAYGFITLGNTLISYVNIITVGINSFSARYIAIHYHKKEFKEANSYFNSVLVANIILGILISIPSLFMILRLEKLINIPKELEIDVKILFIFILFNYFVGVVSSILSSAAFIKNKIEISSKINSASRLLYAVLIISTLYFFGVKIYIVGLINLQITILVAIANGIFAKRLLPEINLNIKVANLKSVKTLASVGIYNSINYLGGTLGSGLDLLLTNKMLTNIIMGQISVASQLGTLMYTAVSAVSNVFQPKQLEAYSHDNLKEVVRLLEISVNACVFFANVFLATFLFIGKPFLNLWIPGQDANKIFVIAVIIIVGNVFSAAITPLYYVATLTTRMKVVSTITIGCGVVNILSMLMLLNSNLDGAYVVVGTTAVLNLVPSVVFPILTKKYFNLKKIPFVKEMLKNFLCVIILICIYCICPKKLVIATWSSLMLYGIIIGILSSLFIGVIVFNKSQMQSLIGFVINKIKKRSL